MNTRDKLIKRHVSDKSIENLDSAIDLLEYMQGAGKLDFLNHIIFNDRHNDINQIIESLKHISKVTELNMYQDKKKIKELNKGEIK
tara:strand:- start:1744 stop:2001 length:258 start_codon:yes stop_codon:yes gene_type:complete